MASDLTLGLQMGAVSVEPVPRGVIEALIEASVRVEVKGPSGFDLTFAAGKTSPITTQLLPSGFFDPPHRVVITATLRGRTTVLMDGVITQQEVVPSAEAGRSILSVKGEDLTRMMDLVDLSGFPYPAMPAEGRVALMLAKYLPVYKIVPLVMPSVLIDVPNPLSTIPVQRGTDLTYLKLLADRVGYTFYLQPGPLPGTSMAYWGPPLRAAIPFLPSPSPLAIDWDGRTNVDSLQFSFDGFRKTLFVVLIQEENSQIPIPIPVPDVTPLSPPLGRKSPMPLRISPLPGLGKYSPIEAAAIALAQASNAANVVSGNGTLDVLRYGEILPPRSIVSVRGAGIVFDGEYFVETVTHSIKPGSYKQSFSLVRNALIAGSGLPGLDALTYGLSAPQQLAGFAAAGAESVQQPLPGVPVPTIPAPPLAGPALPPPVPPGASAPAGAGRVLGSFPASPS